MTDSDILEEPPDDNEAFANLDESLDDEDAQLPGHGPEGERDLETQLVVDRTELEEAGADLDDPERMSLLDGGMDDPDGVGPPPASDADDEAGWDVDPVTHGAGRSTAGDGVEADGDVISDTDLDDVPGEDDTDAIAAMSVDTAGIDIEGLDDSIERPDGR